MAEAVKHPEKVYGGILAQNGAGINVNTDIHYNFPQLRDDFQRAANSEDVVDSHLTDELVGNKTNLYRSDPTDPTPYNFRPDIEPLVLLTARRAVLGPLTAEETKKLDDGIKDLSAKTGLKEDLIRLRLADVEKDLREDSESLLGKFGTVGSPMEREIAGSLIKQVRGVDLSPEEQGKLDQDLKSYAADNHLNAADLQQKIDAFKAKVEESDNSDLDSSTNRLNSTAVSVRKSDGSYYLAEGLPEDNLTIAKYSEDEVNRFRVMGFSSDDLPNRVPPFSIEQNEFITALHESEHAMGVAGRHPVVPKGYDANLVPQAREIDADAAVIKFLNDAGEKKDKDYYLQYRNVASFADGLSGDFDHDTSTFLRVLEKTGQQIDLAQFRDQKKDLMDKINARLDSKNAKTGDIMGAVRDVLSDDKDHPEKKLLTPLQRAEAQQYIEDAKALGFKANSHYPKAVAVAAVDPSAPASPAPQTPAAAV